ncbi:hypothetical protein ACFRQM_14080 [Streptomyces sp. NPDC056831]|uniref:hypothetical protein n=1 Tax=Streptomyces sp. NPDC056831 TaxID=3345954 RepID=UPI0036B39319
MSSGPCTMRPTGRELADELAADKARLKALEDEIEQLDAAHPVGALIRSLAGSGAGLPDDGG